MKWLPSLLVLLVYTVHSVAYSETIDHESGDKWFGETFTAVLHG